MCVCVCVCVCERERVVFVCVCICVRVLSAFGMRQTLIVGMAGEEEGAKWAEGSSKKKIHETFNDCNWPNRQKRRVMLLSRVGTWRRLLPTITRLHTHTHHTHKHTPCHALCRHCYPTMCTKIQARAHTHTHTHTHARSNHTHAQKLKTWMVGMVAACSVDA